METNGDEWLNQNEAERTVAPSEMTQGSSAFADTNTRGEDSSRREGNRQEGSY